MNRTCVALAAAGFAVAMTVPVGAVLGPKHASDLVMLTGSSDSLPCPYNPTLLVVDERLISTGTGIPWTGPPAGQVLVINRVRLWRSAMTPGSSFQLTLQAAHRRGP